MNDWEEWTKCEWEEVSRLVMNGETDWKEKFGHNECMKTANEIDLIDLLNSRRNWEYCEWMIYNYIALQRDTIANNADRGTNPKALLYIAFVFQKRGLIEGEILMKTIIDVFPKTPEAERAKLYLALKMDDLAERKLRIEAIKKESLTEMEKQIIIEQL